MHIGTWNIGFANFHKVLWLLIIIDALKAWPKEQATLCSEDMQGIGRWFAEIQWMPNSKFEQIPPKKKLNLQHYCRKDFNIRTLRTKIWIKSRYEDKPQVAVALATSCSKRKETFSGENIYLSSHKGYSVYDRQQFFKMIQSFEI